MSQAETIGPGERFAREVESELAATPRLLWTFAGLFLAAAAIGVVGYFQEDGSIYFLVALAILFVALLPLGWALGNELWRNEMQADADKARASDRRWAEREAALNERKTRNAMH